MELVEITPRLHLVRYAFGQAYLWQDDDGLTMVDAGIAGSAADTAAAIRAAGRAPEELCRVVLTHSHADHAGAAAELRAWGGVEVLAHRADAPVIRGDRPAAEPVLLDWERPLFEQNSPQAGGLTGPPCAVDRELRDGEEIAFGGGARVLEVPGHTDGSIALHLPHHGVLFTGDSIAQLDGKAVPGVFNTDREKLLESFGRLAALDVEIACFGHTDPFTRDAGKKLREAA
ncbi:MBL fold metallo-hydrolase [Amycolatopsis sp. NPDC051045]|uniref:MBL fold metallo-hydrolase n=1 Tax=Amycolatopsis sp. NPDC051045 TaxID=3156922 RepID=UPI003430DB87